MIEEINEQGVVDVKDIKTVNEGYEFMDRIPDFEFTRDEIYRICVDTGHIPIMWTWFEPLNKDGTEDMVSTMRIAQSREYKDWGLGKKVESVFDYWKENNFGVAYFTNPSSKEMLSQWEEEGNLENNLQKLNTRGIEAHIARLLTHEQAPACTDFALAVMKYLPEMDMEKVKEVYFNQIGDGDEQAQFWTIAPYIYEALRRNRVMEGKPENDREDFLRIFMWLRSRKRTGEWGGDAIYPGVKGLRSFRDRLYLPRNGFHPIHKFVERVGEHLASYLEKVSVREEVVFENGEIRKA